MFERSIHKLQTQSANQQTITPYLFTIDYKHIFFVKKHNYLHNNLGMLHYYIIIIKIYINKINVYNYW